MVEFSLMNKKNQIFLKKFLGEHEVGYFSIQYLYRKIYDIAIQYLKNQNDIDVQIYIIAQY